MEKKRQHPQPSCASCRLGMHEKICFVEKGTGSKGCPTLTRKDVLIEANAEYEVPEIKKFAKEASVQEAEGYANRHQRPYIIQPAKTRIEEICEFAEKMGYKRLGLVFCFGLSDEARVVDTIFKARGFEVVSVICKAGRTFKEIIGIEDEDKIFQGKDETMCNPIFQAKLLNHEKTEFNVLLGLCVGHDSLFLRYAEAPNTVLAVKDRVTGHNPLAAVYLAQSYYQKLKSRNLKNKKD